MDNHSGANRALGLRPEPAPQFRPIGFDHGYALGIYVPRTMNRLANRLVLAVMLGLIPVSIWAYETRPPADASITATGPSAQAGVSKGQGSSQ